LLDHDSCESEDRQCNSSGERQIHDRNRKPARNPDPSQATDERVEEQGDEQRHEEQEDRVTYRSRHHPDEQQQQRKPYELYPPGNDDPGRRGGARHDADRSSPDDWGLFEQGSLALDPYELWVEPEELSAGEMSRGRLKVARSFDTVPPDMPSSRPNRRRRVERREVRAARRARRFALLTLLATVLVVALLLTAFGGGNGQLQRLSVTEIPAVSQTAPFPQILAIRGPVRLQMPISQTLATAIGYHSASDGALPLAPMGRQGNEGVVQRVFHKLFGGSGGRPIWYALDGGTTTALDVGAAPGTDVYAPVDGTIVGISPYVVAGHRFGSRIDIQPQSAPSVIVSLTQIRADPSLSVGSNVVNSRSKVGTVVNLAMVERQALARYTNDAGNHVSIELRPATALVLN
jgi:murein DD-endopeptidase MepM/ murein hydrolase activator NlpD